MRIAFMLFILGVALPLHASDAGVDFFEKKIRPALVDHCYKCHSADAKKLKGGLRLDLKAGWQLGGDSGKPAVVPGKPEESPLIRAIRHDNADEAMPPNQSKLPAYVIADFVAWVKMGAPDPRDGNVEIKRVKQDWETIYAERLKWWSLQPLAVKPPPKVAGARNDVDRFLFAALAAKGLKPAAEADRRTLARRLSFALTGLPPTIETVDRFLADTSPTAYEALVQTLLASPHFGERWARHWMDVVHYADTHGYEWDTPAKHAWRYRDYLIRAFNDDVPFDRMILEQLAGDLISPRLHDGANEALIGPMALRLGERRHGDSAQVEGVTQETMANIIDTVSKGFLATTVACAQCHDHKLDAVGQRDYYALAGVFMSTRWGVRPLEAVDVNEAVIAELRPLKQRIRGELAKRWLGTRDELIAKLQALPVQDKPGFPETYAALYQRMRKAPIKFQDYLEERQRRVEANNANLKLLADFTVANGAKDWHWEGAGMKHGLVREGEIVIAETGDMALSQILPAGRWSHAWSPRLAGALRSPLLEGVPALSLGFAGGKHVGQSFILDHAFHSERMKFLNQPNVGWLTLSANKFDTLEGSIDKMPRRVYLELATKSLNNYFPPRTGYGGVTESDAADPRSWFGLTRVYAHPVGKPPIDMLARFAPLLAGQSDPATKLATALLAAVERWGRDACRAEDVLLLDEALRAGWLANDLKSESLAKLVAEYRTLEKKLEPERTVGSVSEWNEARNERIGIRGSYTDFGAEVPRGNIRFLGGPVSLKNPHSSGRLELAQSIASPNNPLTARVYVNRVWLHLFGEGLVRTPDDFGHLGQAPTHPELLDYLADRFLREGWSTKKLVTFLVTSAAWRQSSAMSKEAYAVDPENRLLHHMPMRRLEAEAIRDALLAVSGRLDPQLFGPPIDPYRTAEDAAKRLLRGPLDGNGRRSIYTKMTLMEPPRFLALFNQPIPRLTVGKRDVSDVPDQALALLNDPFVLAMAKHWSERELKVARSAEQRIAAMFTAAFARPPSGAESARLMKFLARSAELRGASLQAPIVWQDLAHALINMREFIYVP